MAGACAAAGVQPRARSAGRLASWRPALGARLFERSARRLRPTPAGEAFYPARAGRRGGGGLRGARSAILGSAPRGLLRINRHDFWPRIHRPLLPALTEHTPGWCELVTLSTRW